MPISDQRDLAFDFSITQLPNSRMGTYHSTQTIANWPVAARTADLSWLPWFRRSRGPYSGRNADKRGAAICPFRGNSDIPIMTQRSNDRGRDAWRCAPSSAAVLDLAW